MKPDILKARILSLEQDIEFIYLGKQGSICPFSHDNIALAYDGQCYEHTDIDALMNDKIFGGAALNQISEQIELQ